MINYIFWDLDETLIHAHNESHINYDFIICLTDGGWEDETYKVKVHPAAKEIINYSRELVGDDKVFILTAAVNEYANIINAKAEFGFAPQNIIAREQTRNILRQKDSTYSNSDNVLIDNLTPEWNEDKMKVIGINANNYLQVRDYYGVDFTDSKESFFQQCKLFLNEKHFKEL